MDVYSYLVCLFFSSETSNIRQSRFWTAVDTNVVVLRLSRHIPSYDHKSSAFLGYT